MKNKSAYLQKEKSELGKHKPMSLQYNYMTCA
jgi:hypothetical protein